MLLGIRNTKAFRELEEAQYKRGSVNKDTTDMEEGDNYNSLQEFTEESTPGGNRLILQHNDGTLCVSVATDREILHSESDVLPLGRFKMTICR